MKKLDKEFPAYDFAKNKGYGTPNHLEVLKKSGYTSFHRKSFKGVVV
jgi:ribonuclease HII